MVTDKEEASVLIDQCESGFEREVFSILASRGYRVMPQVKTGAYRIDMVVEGAGDNRLAIKLNGDEYHGPDRWPHDMNRQRVLERAGWVFWRCFASTWSLRKDDVLQELLERLTALGIEPTGAIEHAPNLVEKRIWKFKPVEDNVLKLGSSKLWRGSLLMTSESYKSVQQKMYLSKQTNRGDLLKPHINTSRLWTNDT